LVVQLLDCGRGVRFCSVKQLDLQLLHPMLFNPELRTRAVATLVVWGLILAAAMPDGCKTGNICCERTRCVPSVRAPGGEGAGGSFHSVFLSEKPADLPG
jgi:hypothetical protein